MCVPYKRAFLFAGLAGVGRASEWCCASGRCRASRGIVRDGGRRSVLVASVELTCLHWNSTPEYNARACKCCSVGTESHYRGLRGQGATGTLRARYRCHACPFSTVNIEDTCACLAALREKCSDFSCAQHMCIQHPCTLHTHNLLAAPCHQPTFTFVRMQCGRMHKWSSFEQ